MDDRSVQQRVQAAMLGITGVSLAIYRDDLLRDQCEVVEVDVRAEEDFVHVTFANGSVLCFAHDCDVPAVLLEAMYLGIAAEYRLLAVPRH